MTGIKGPTLFLISLSDCIMFKFGIYKEKTVWTRIHSKQFFYNFEYLGLQKRLNIFWGFEGKTRFHQVRKTESEYGSETQKWRKNSLFFDAQPHFLELKWIEIYIFIHYNFFPPTKIDPKVIGLLHYHYNVNNKLSILNFSLLKYSHKILLKPTF